MSTTLPDRLMNALLVVPCERERRGRLSLVLGAGKHVRGRGDEPVRGDVLVLLVCGVGALVAERTDRSIVCRFDCCVRLRQNTEGRR